MKLIDNPASRSSLLETPPPIEVVRSLSDVKRPTTGGRPRVEGKFLHLGGTEGGPFFVKGVSYGAFRPDTQKNEYQDFAQIERDFEQMAAWGINTVRIPHTMPPRALLDIAQRYGLYVMVGLSAEQYVGYLADRRGAPDVERLVREKVRTVAGHPALLCYGLGNEIPAPLARWLGARRIERYLHRLYKAVKAEDPEGLVTYVNYPTAEYLELPFLDFLSFNVYLEQRDRLEAYLARLHNLAGNRPLLLSEVGLDSYRNGVGQQAEVLEWQVRASFEAGCCGTVIFAWTDEWYRAGEDVLDWEFGLVDRSREPKPALQSVSRAYADLPFDPNRRWPAASVVVCTYNGARTIRQTLQHLERLDYPDYEVIVVDDGSTDDTAAIVEEFPAIKLVRTTNRGLSAARNTGWQLARSEIVAYIDDDAYPDSHWLRFLAHAFETDSHAAVGGPNIPPPGDTPTAACVAVSPGGPAHVLITDREAEHIPGCNMAFRRDVLEAVGGFDEQFRVAGDDVDICWQLLSRGHTIGFSAAAVVWHHRRGSARAYWKQQRGYGQAEALLERKWPEKYNCAGHLTWSGRVYGPGTTPLLRLFGKSRIYHGPWGTAPFQSRHEPALSLLSSLPLMPEWYLVLAGLGLLSALGLLWSPLLLAVPVLGLAMTATVVGAVWAARASRHDLRRAGCPPTASRLALTAGLHLMQPLARLLGRLAHGLSPWRRRGVRGRAALAAPWPRSRAILRKGAWQPPEEKLLRIEASLVATGAVVRRGGAFDRWDLNVHGGLLGGARALLAIEDHGPVTQLIRLRTSPTASLAGIVLALLLSGLAVAATFSGATAAALLLGAGSVLLTVRLVGEIMWASGSLSAAAGGALADGKAVSSGGVP